MRRSATTRSGSASSRCRCWPTTRRTWPPAGCSEQHAWDLGLKEIRLYTNAKMWENQLLYPRYGYQVTEQRTEGDYDRIHHRKRLVG